MRFIKKLNHLASFYQLINPNLDDISVFQMIYEIYYQRQLGKQVKRTEID